MRLSLKRVRAAFGKDKIQKHAETVSENYSLVAQEAINSIRYSVDLFCLSKKMHARTDNEAPWDLKNMKKIFAAGLVLA